jgi:hypothetical protein
VGQVVVFAGPTIAAEDVRAVLPQAQVRPPVARGDLLGGGWSPSDVVVIIDGYFRERRSVGHKEILWLLDEGVEVIGAGSMGALRAAELAPCGMRGLGEVYRMYVDGEIDGDDEVGMLHGPAAMGYPAHTVALVNLRYATREATRTGMVPAEVGDRIVAATKALPFTFRTWPEIEQELDVRDRPALGPLKWMITSGEWDIKLLDALTALRHVGEADAPTRPTSECPIARMLAGHPSSRRTVVTGIGGNQRLAQQSRREYAPGRWMSNVDVLNAARLFDDRYPEIHERALTCLLTDLAAEHDLTLAGYAQLKLGVEQGSPLPVELASWLSESERATTAPAGWPALVMTRVWPLWQSVDWRPAVLSRLRESASWDQWCDIVACADEIAEQTRYRLVVPSPPIRGRLFLRHWRRPGSSPEIDMARRGFASLAELGAAVGRFFAYDVQRGRSLAIAGAR